MKQNLSALVLVTILAGCASARVNPYKGAAGLPPTDPAQVRVYRAFPPGPYQVIGEVNYEGAQLASWSGAETLMRQKAAAIGGEAVVILMSDSPVVARYTTPGHVDATTTGTEMGNIYARPYGASYQGTYNQQTRATYTPPSTTEIRKKYISGVVIRYVQPQTAEEWRQAGLQYAQQDQPEQAEKAFAHAAQIEPDNAGNWVALALVLQHLGRTHDRDVVMAELERLDPALAAKTRATLTTIQPR